MKKIKTLLAKMALKVVEVNVNSACISFIHQPKLPDNAKKFRKF